MAIGSAGQSAKRVLVVVGPRGNAFAIEEIRRYFFGEDLVFTRFTNSVAFDTFTAEDWTLSPGGLAGIRFFVGKYGVLFGSLAGGRGLQAGYTRYNLFDRHIFFSLGLTANGCCPVRVFPLGIDPTFSSWQNEDEFRETQITLGLPLGVERSVHAEAGAQWKQGTTQLKASVFATRFSRYIALDATGNTIDLGETGLGNRRRW
ncbi:MAG: hypothetical protein HC779_08370 [Phyllobacteriaceae bacterium]|nr:hypothetical protein [Phyllobacteriaceae bacterium]